ncbi:MAG: LPS export ABC transporter periplasmic protein LptC, partial [Paramuribaculum sp.]|nr:LPS export ABC transporter periplasmic protein LptC [Paramuribaculum sp.]
GITRYRIITPLWLMYEEASEPKWRFPNGLKLEKFDPKFKVDASIECDSATYFKDKQLWRLDGYVDVKNLQGEKFLTEQLFWNQRTQKIYSDSFIHIERSGRVIEGYGFESNETMTDYHVLRVSGIFPSSQFKTDSASRERAAADTAQPRPVMPAPSLREPNRAIHPSNAPLRRLDGANIQRGNRPNTRLEPVTVVDDSPNLLMKKKK